MSINTAHAGTLESGDILVQISPSSGSGVEINLDSVVAYQFGRQIKDVIRETLQSLNIDGVIVDATDKGALDCTIRARVTAAAVRATGQDVWKD
jgi:citrate lyase subunit gamma (acyl carrier protein)